MEAPKSSKEEWREIGKAGYWQLEIQKSEIRKERENMKADTLHDIGQYTVDIT